MAKTAETRALTIMRNLLAAGFSDEQLLVGNATELLVAVGTERPEAEKVSQRVFDRHFKVAGAM